MKNKGSSYRVLLIAEAANPEWVSVPLVGFSLVRSLAKFADVHFVTHIRNRDAIVRAGMIEGQDFTCIDNESVAAPLYKTAEKLRGGSGKGWTTVTALSSLAYYAFESALWRVFEERLVAREFDIVHRVTPLSPTSPSIIAKRLAKLGIPFIVGPLNGGVPWPRHFKDRQIAEREWLAGVRWLYRLMPGYRSTRRYSTAIITGSGYTRSEMPQWAQHKCIHIPENGIDLDAIGPPRHRAASRPLRGAFVGRLVAYKGADMLIVAAAKFLKAGDMELDIVGDGPEKAKLKSLAEKLGVAAGIRFHGWLPRSEGLDVLRTCDFMALPSIREFGGGIVVEAMALGVAPIVADYAGPSELVDDATGMRIPFQDEKSLVEALERGLETAVRHPEILDELGMRARQKASREWTWDAKAKKIISVYDAIINGSQSSEHSSAIDTSPRG